MTCLVSRFGFKSSRFCTARSQQRRSVWCRCPVLKPADFDVGAQYQCGWILMRGGPTESEVFGVDNLF